MVNASHEVLVEIPAGAVQPNLETIFAAQYRPITRAIAGFIQDPGRAEELAVEVFLKWSRQRGAQGATAKAWLYTTASRLALDELRRQARRQRYEESLGQSREHAGGPDTPETVFSARQNQRRVQLVLAAMNRRQAQLLLLRSQGFDYAELAGALGLKPASVGTLLSRAEQAFRKEYIRKYGEQ